MWSYERSSNKTTGSANKNKNMLTQFDIHSELMVDPWLVRPADRRPKATPKCELMDEAMEPRDHPEVTTEVNPVGPTFSGDSTKVARHCERTPPELERRVEPLWLLMGETREPAREPQAHPEVTMRYNPICLNSAGNAAVGSP